MQEDLPEIDRKVRLELDSLMSKEGLTQVDIAEKMEKSRQIVNSVISGRRGLIPANLREILDAADCTLKVVKKHG